MKHALVLLMVLSACGMEGAAFDEGSTEQALVTELPLDIQPPDLAALAACIDLPDQLSLDWVKQHLLYNNDCYQSWAVKVDLSECPVGKRSLDGDMLFAGNRMAKVPQSGFLIRAKAASAALLDLADLAIGKGKPRIDFDIAGDGMSMSACASPLENGYHFDVGLDVDNSVLGPVGASGGVDYTKADGILTSSFSLGVTATPPNQPAIAGELTGTGLTVEIGSFCPDAGEVVFAGTIGADTAEVSLSYLGEGALVITLPDGQTIGPDTPRYCK